ncbi:MAG: ATP-grasp domain-containing protein [Dehalococcoidales bacterium]|nr:ATP-grasp domain-containing protein [Dehalococcoidales bacterium]
MLQKVTIIYNDPYCNEYCDKAEAEAILGVLDAVSSVRDALEALQCACTILPLNLPFSSVRSELSRIRADVVFNLFEGFPGMPGSESAIAKMMEETGLCFTGSPSAALVACENKVTTKHYLRSAGIPTANWNVLCPDDTGAFNLRWPCIVKPMGEHASHGLSQQSVVADMESLSTQVTHLYRSYCQPALVEEFLEGREFRVLLLGNGEPRAFPIEEIVYLLPPGKPHLLTYCAKWVQGHPYFVGTKEECPANIETRLAKQLKDLAVRSFHALSCRGYASVDMRLDKDGQPFVIDVNANPDISSCGGAKCHIEAAGCDYPALIGEVLCLTRESFEDRGGATQRALQLRRARSAASSVPRQQMGNEIRRYTWATKR